MLKGFKEGRLEFEFSDLEFFEILLFSILDAMRFALCPLLFMANSNRRHP